MRDKQVTKGQWNGFPQPVRHEPQMCTEGLEEMLSISVGKIAILLLRAAGVVFLLVLTSASYCYSADVVFIGSHGSTSAEQEQLEIATTFYGLNLRVVIADSANDGTSLIKAVRGKDTVGVAIAEDALAVVNRAALLRALHREKAKNVPLLILGVNTDVDPVLLRTWSGAAVLGCKQLESPVGLQYVFGRVDGLTGQLADLEIPLLSKNAFYLVSSGNNSAQPIISLGHGQEVSPFFVETRVEQLEVFLACTTAPDTRLTSGVDIAGAFLRVAPAMIFVRYSAGERGWHSLHHYANFTIDDPWLRQPYGYVDYSALLGEMEKHNFHTTIAFVPWNYDRSEPGVVSLFRDHPERFSIAIHGNNHDHKEFTDYRSKPLAVQTATLRQSLARMEKFRTLTGIQYDKVMIFPHSIAPERTLEALKAYNYLATINSTNVPQDSVNPLALGFALRPVTLSFANFPSISRYSVAAPVPMELIAISEFLDNPLFFYGHSDLFARGIDAFDGVADEVNTLEPDTQWRSLGDIVRELYAVKVRDDSNFDVLAFSSNICLDNSSGRDSIYYVRKEESGSPAISSVIVDGHHYPSRLQQGYLNLTVPVPMGGTRCVAIQYENDLELASISSLHGSIAVYVLRMASDFRDIYLSKFPGGLAVIRFYNDHNVKPAQALGCLFVFLVVCIYAVDRLHVLVKRRRICLTKAKEYSQAD